MPVSTTINKVKTAPTQVEEAKEEVEAAAKEETETTEKVESDPEPATEI